MKINDDATSYFDNMNKEEQQKYIQIGIEDGWISPYTWEERHPILAFFKKIFMPQSPN